MTPSFLINPKENQYKISLVLMLGLIGLSDNPSNEKFGLLPRLRQQLEWDHVQHLDGLVELCVQLA
jgi:hypothetical protein